MGYYSRHYSIVAGQYTLTSPRGGLIYQPMIWIQVVYSPTRTTSTPRRRVFKPPSIAIINAPFSSVHHLLEYEGTFNKRQALQVISKTRDSFDQIGNDLS
jgi:hypothetical protein